MEQFVGSDYRPWVPPEWEEFRRRNLFMVTLPQRTHEAIEYAQTLYNQPNFNGDIDKSNPEAAKQEVVSRLFTASTMIVGGNLLVNAARKAYPQWTYLSQFVRPHFDTILAGNSTVQSLIEDYAKLFRFETSHDTYKSLLDILRSASYLVIDECNLQDQSTLRHQESKIGNYLTGLIGEYMVVNGLKRGGYPDAHHSSASQDVHFGIDVIVPRPQGPLDLQVKAISTPFEDISFKTDHEIPRVVIPIHRSSSDAAFHLNEASSKKLIDFVNTWSANI